MKTLIAQLNKSLLGLTPLRDLLEMTATGTGPEGGRLWAAGQQGATRSLVKEERSPAASSGLELLETSLLCSRLAQPHCVSAGQGN